MKKLLSLFVPLMALFLALAPQTARAQSPLTITNETPLTFFYNSSNAGARFEIIYGGTWGTKTRPLFEYRILKSDGTTQQDWTAATYYGSKTSTTATKMQMKRTSSGGENSYFILTSSTSSSYPSGYGIQFRLASGSTWNVTKDNYIYFSIYALSGTKEMEISGNILSLVSRDSYSSLTEIPSNYCFYNLFKDAGTSTHSNIDASKLLLPATILKTGCYEEMFSGCAGFLTKGPNIMAFNPESDCATDCFKNMFNGCSNMTQLTTNFLSWGTGTGTSNWLNGCTKCTTVNCPSSLDVSSSKKTANYIGTNYSSGSGNVSPNVYVFNVAENSGTWNGTCQADKYYTTGSLTVPNPNEDGFTGWYTASSGGSAVTPGSLSNPSSVTTYYAQFSSVTTYNVAIDSYNTDYGTVTVAYNDGEDDQEFYTGDADIVNTTVLTISAEPKPGYKLTGLTITPSGGDPSDFTSGNEHTLTANITVTATFVAKSFTLAINSTSNGTIACDNVTYVQDGTARAISVGTTVNFTATPAEHYVLTGWTGAVSGTGLQKSLTVGANMDEVLTVGATFALEQFTVTASPNNALYGSVTGGGTHDYGSVTVTATANEGYRFVDWNDGTSSVSSNASYTFTLSENVTLTANFALESENKTVNAYQNITADTTKILYALTPKTVGGITYTPIDLGYGVAWSDRNIGAATTGAVGSHFLYGGTSARTEFRSNTYETGIASVAVDADYSTDYDAAYQIIGHYWRVPSKSDWQALINEFGAVTSFTSKIDGNVVISLPADGYIQSNVSSQSHFSTSEADYWSRTKGYKGSGSNDRAWSFKNGSLSNGVTGYASYGMPIRPIYQPTFTIYTLTINVGSYKYVYKCQSGQSITVDVHATELGATFNEWSEDHNTNATRTFTVTSNMTYTATFTEATTYSITFVDDDGETVLDGPKSVIEGVVPTYGGETPTKVATAQYTYSFNGWSPALYAANKNQTYTATYSGTLNQYTITWKNEDGGETLETDADQNYGTTTAFNGSTPTKAATAQYTYTFDGWATSAGGEKVYNNGETPTVGGAATYYAHFTSTKQQYTLAWETDGDALTGDYTSGTIDWGTAITAPATPTKPGKDFAGWRSSISGEVEDPVAATMPTANLTYTATWITAVVRTLDLYDNRDAAYYDNIQALNGEEYTSVTYHRSEAYTTDDEGNARWYTLCLPFDVDQSQLDAAGLFRKVYEFRYATGSADEGKQVNFHFRAATAVVAGRGYLLKATETMSADYTFTSVTLNTDADTQANVNDLKGSGYKTSGEIEIVGVLRKGTLAADGQRVMGLANNKIWYPNGSGNPMPAYRAYFYTANPEGIAPRVRIVVEGEDATELEVVDGELINAADSPVRKYMENGMLIIELNGIRYNAQGQRM